MTRRPGSTTIDPRREPEDVEAGDRHHIDRVYRPVGSPTTPANAPAAPRENDTTLRRAMTRLERELADTKRELATKDEELAAVLEKQLLAGAELKTMREKLRSTTTASAEAARTAQQREKLWESTVAQLRQQVKELQAELARAKAEKP